MGSIMSGCRDAGMPGCWEVIAFAIPRVQSRSEEYMPGWH